MYLFYVALFYLLLPLLIVLRYIKGLRWTNFNARWKECLGYYSKKHTQSVIWLHAASVGEVEAAHALISDLRKHYSARILVTTGTEPGYDRVSALQGDQVDHVYLPYDVPFAVERFIEHFRPQLAIIMETEIWPVLFANCEKYAIPLFIVNARLSERSSRSYLRIKGFLQQIFSGIAGVVVQTEFDARRYQAIGVSAEKISVSGNIKLDMQIADNMQAQAKKAKQALFSGRQLFVVGSTHQGEDEIFLKAYLRLKSTFPALLLILVPRQPRRAGDIKRLCFKLGLHVIARTEGISCAASIDVYLVDTLGELKQMYAMADCSFVAGSMVPVGGHNIFEPILLGVPVMFGPHMKNVELLAQQLLDAGGAIRCVDEGDIVRGVTQLLADPELSARLINSSRAFVEDNKGALQRTIVIIESFMHERKPKYQRD